MYTTIFIVFSPSGILFGQQRHPWIRPSRTCRCRARQPVTCVLRWVLIGFLWDLRWDLNVILWYFMGFWWDLKPWEYHGIYDPLPCESWAFDCLNRLGISSAVYPSLLPTSAPGSGSMNLVINPMLGYDPHNYAEIYSLSSLELHFQVVGYQ